MSVSNLVLTADRKAVLDAGFAGVFGAAPQRYFSAPGRTEVSGNHTDHQRGRVLAAAVNLDTVAAVRVNGTDTIRILSEFRGMQAGCKYAEGFVRAMDGFRTRMTERVLP